MADPTLKISEERKRVFVTALIVELPSVEVICSIEAVTPARNVATVVSCKYSEFTYF